MEPGASQLRARENFFHIINRLPRVIPRPNRKESAPAPSTMNRALAAQTSARNCPSTLTVQPQVRLMASASRAPRCKWFSRNQLPVYSKLFNRGYPTPACAFHLHSSVSTCRADVSRRRVCGSNCFKAKPPK